MSRERYVFIDPDGTADPGLVVLVLAPTGVFYETQAGGHYSDKRDRARRAACRRKPVVGTHTGKARRAHLRAKDMALAKQ